MEATGLSRTQCAYLVKNAAGLKWYKDRKIARVNNNHQRERVIMAEQWEYRLRNDPDWISKTWFTDESKFNHSLGVIGNTGNWYFSGDEARQKQFVYQGLKLKISNE